MGCDYYIDKEAEMIEIKVYDYDNASYGTPPVKTITIPADQFEDGRMDIEIAGAKRR